MAALSPTAVNARQVTTDTGQGGQWGAVVSPGCTLDGQFDCVGVSLGFSADFGTGLTDTAYLYDDGMVSFGSKVSGFGPGTVAVMLSETLATGLLDPKLYQTGFWQAVANGVKFTWADCYSYSTLSSGCRNSETALTVTKDPVTGTVSIVGYGDDRYFDQTRYVRELRLEEYGFTSRRAQYGYQLGGQQLSLTPIAAPATRDAVVTWGFGADLPAAAVAAVPEPNSWAMMILGFGLIGGALRRRRQVCAPA